MSSSKEIELILQAKLEASQAVSQAEAMGRAIVGQIENAIDNSRIADKLIEQISKAFGKNFNMLNFGQGGVGGMETPGFSRNQAGIYVPNAATEATRPAPTAAPQGLNPNTTSTTTPVNDPSLQSGNKAAQDAAMNAARIAQSSTLGGVFNPSGGIFTSIASNLGGRRGQSVFGTEAYGDASKLDDLISRVSMASNLKKLDPKFDSTQLYSPTEITEAQKLVKAAAASASDGLSNIRKEIAGREQFLLENKDKFEKINKEGAADEKDQQFLDKYEKVQNKLIEALDKRSELVSQAREATVQNEKLKQALPAEATPFYKDPGKMSAALSATAGIVTTVGNFASQYDIYKGVGKAGERELGNFTGRQIMDKDYTSVIATQQLGGLDKLKDEAESSYRTGLFARLGGGALALGGTAITALSGGTLGLPGLAIAATGAGLVASGAQQMMEKEKIMADYMKQRQGLKMLENKEFMDVYNESAGLARNSFQTALGMGSDTMSTFLYGGGDKNGVAYRSMNSGLTRDQILGNQRAYAASIGQVVNGNFNLNDSAVQSNIVELNKLQGMGFYNASQTAAAYYNGGDQSLDPIERARRATQEARQVYSDVFKAGTSEEAVPRLIQMMNEQGSRMPGGMDMAEYNMRSVLGAAQKGDFGDIKSNPLLDIRSQVQSSLMKSLNTGAGVEGMAKRQAIDSLSSQLKGMLGDKFKGLSNSDMLALQLGGIDKGFVEKIAKDSGGELSEQQVQTVMDSFNNSAKSNLATLEGTWTGGDKMSAAMIKARQMLGPNATTTALQTAAKQIISEESGFSEVKGGPIESKIAAPGRKETEMDATIEITKTTAGFKSLNDVLATLNPGMNEFVKNIEKLANIANGTEKAANTQKGYRESPSGQMGPKTSAPPAKNK